VVAGVVAVVALLGGGGVYYSSGTGGERPKGREAKKIPAAPTHPSEDRPADRTPGVAHRPEALAVVREAVARRFGEKVVVTAVRLEDGHLTLQGQVDRWETLQPAREAAVRALEESGLGPVRSWDNHLKKPKK
jgi:hypothetical protein